MKMKDVRIGFRVSQDLASLKEINGIGSYCPSSSLIKISLDPNHKEVKKNLARVLEQALFHELHHAARWGAGEMGETLFGHLMNEGLADHYALKQTGLKSPWLKQISKKELDRFISRAEKEYRNEKFSYEDWFSRGSK